MCIVKSWPKSSTIAGEEKVGSVQLINQFSVALRDQDSAGREMS